MEPGEDAVTGLLATSYDFLWIPSKLSKILKFISLAVQATIQDVVPSRSCASTEWHGACPSAGTFRVHLEGPANLWGQPC